MPKDHGTAKHTPKRTADQREADLVEIAQLRIQGYTEQEIADDLSRRRPYSLTRAQIWEDLQTIRAGWKAQRQQNVEALFAEEERLLLEVRKEAFRAYRRSANEQTETTTTIHTEQGPKELPAASQGKKGDKKSPAAQAARQLNKIQITKKKPPGDPGYLAVILQTNKALREMHALDAPKKISVTPAPTGEGATESGVVFLPAITEEPPPTS